MAYRHAQGVKNVRRLTIPPFTKGTDQTTLATLQYNPSSGGKIMKKLCCFLTIATLMLGTAVSFAKHHEEKRGEGVRTEKMERAEKGERKGKYPNVEATAKHLEQAKKSLEQVKADLGPHKAEVAKAIDMALMQLRQGVTYADAHPREKKEGDRAAESNTATAAPASGDRK